MPVSLKRNTGSSLRESERWFRRRPTQCLLQPRGGKGGEISIVSRRDCGRASRNAPTSGSPAEGIFTRFREPSNRRRMRVCNAACGVLPLMTEESWRRPGLRKVRAVRMKTSKDSLHFTDQEVWKSPVAEEKLSNGTLSRRAKRPVWMRVRFENVPGKTKAGKRKRVARPLVEGVSSMRFCASGAFGRRGRSARGPRARRSRAQG